MLFFFYGDDFSKRQNKVFGVLEAVKKKRPWANFLHFDSFDLSIEKLKEFLKSQGLFEEKNILLLTNIFINLDLKNWILENIEEFEKSNSAFIFSEEKITALEKKKIEKFAFQIQEFKLREEKTENLFLISDYIQKKDRKKAWVLFNENLEKGVDIDNLFGIIFWSFKALLLAEKFSEKESGIKSYPYQKAKRNLIFWKKEELEKKFFRLLELQIKARRGELDLRISLEKFLLEL